MLLVLLDFGSLCWHYRPRLAFTGKKKEKTTMETLFLSFAGSEASMVYTLLSGPIVKTLFPFFPPKWKTP